MNFPFTGDIEAAIVGACAVSGSRDVYTGGANVIDQALEHGLVDELVPYFSDAPAGARLFNGATRHELGIPVGAKVGHRQPISPARSPESSPIDQM